MDNLPTGAEIHISLYNLIIEIRQNGVYPDQVQDMANRAITLFREALATCQALKLDIRDFELEDDGE